MITFIENSPIEYDWGSVTAIPALLGRKPTGRPQAELWFGAHPSSPAQVVGSSQSLLDIAPDLPFLLKVLAADAPLSIQAHPDPHKARIGFDREERDQILPRLRSFVDPFAKPEMIYALSDPLRALCGFAPIPEVRAALIPAIHNPDITDFHDRLQSEADLPNVVRWILDRTEEVDRLVEALTREAASLAGALWQTVRTLSARWPGDAGIAMSVLMNLVELRRGEVLDVPAGRIHAYLHGLGIELMGPSDNVQRGGLTSKRIDIDGLLSVLDFRTERPKPVVPIEAQPGVHSYMPKQGDFFLTVVEKASARVALSGAAIVFCGSGSAIVDGHLFAAGDAALLSDQDHVEVRDAELLFVAIGNSAVMHFGGIPGTPALFRGNGLRLVP